MRRCHLLAAAWITRGRDMSICLAAVHVSVLPFASRKCWLLPGPQASSQYTHTRAGHTSRLQHCGSSHSQCSIACVDDILYDVSAVSAGASGHDAAVAAPERAAAAGGLHAARSGCPRHPLLPQVSLSSYPDAWQASDYREKCTQPFREQDSLVLRAHRHRPYPMQPSGPMCAVCLLLGARCIMSCIIQRRRGSLYGMLHSPTLELTWAQVAAMCLGAAKGMQHLHAHSVLHRDLKSGAFGL